MSPSTASGNGKEKEVQPPSSSAASSQIQTLASQTTSNEPISSANNNNNGGGNNGIPISIEKLAKDQEMKETSVNISMPSDTDSLEITLSSNLVIKAIKPNSCALYKLIIGDQLLNIAGHVPSSSEHAIELIRQSKPRFVLVVNRPQNREPVAYARAASIQLKRTPGFAYFVVNLRKYDKVHLGLGIRPYRNKIMVNRTDENSLAAFAYLVGDAILDVNCERITDVAVLQKRLIDSLIKYGTCNTVVERPESAIAIHNTRVVSAFLNTQGTTDPAMPGDVICIAQREIVRYRANMNKQLPKGIYRHVEPIKDYEDKSGDIVVPEGVECSNANFSAGIIERSFRRKRSSSNDSRKKVVFNLKPTEVAIASDVQNAMFLQKIRSNQRTPHALTFMPKIFTQGFSRRSSSDSSASDKSSSSSGASSSPSN